MSKSAPFERGNRPRTMDVEHINTIGKDLADLSRRTQELRGYL
jgi:hypothetical protein